jgi:sugar phosphate isomerase/epimerase
MKLSLSGRIIERGGYSMELPAFLRFAKNSGYEGVEIRYPQLPLETPEAVVDETAELLKKLELTWAFGSVEGIIGEEAFERAVRMLDIHKKCDCLFTRFVIKEDADIVWAQNFADAAAERGQSLIMQLHCGTLPDNVEHALAAFEQIDRPNIGLAFDACHLRFDGDEDHIGAIGKLADHIVGASAQNYKAAKPADPEEGRITINGIDYLRALPGDPDGLDFPAIFGALKEVGFDGFATVMCDTPPGMEGTELAKKYYSCLKSLL